MKTFAAILLVAATALTPFTAAQAQREGREGREDRRMERADRPDRAPRGPEIRQMDRRDWQRGGGSETRSRDDHPRGEWRRDGQTQWAPPGSPYDRNRDGNLDRRWDRNRDGQADPNWDRNGNGRVDRQWDRNRDGNLDRRWDRNNDERVDRRWDRNRDGYFDRRWDQNRDGRVDRYGYYRRGYDQRSWNHSWRNDRRYDWYGHRSRYRDQYRLGRYYAPVYGHRYSRFSIGFSIGAPFYSSRYWINDPWRYRLPEVYGPYRWVRYYDDVLLVDIYSGRVVDVIHNFFW
jgi:hypothetical protein